MSRAKQRADRIRAEVSILKILADYGYRVNAYGEDREQQFPCDLHGDGSDSIPSARVYPATNSMYCFACDRSRDPIQIVREKEGLNFWEAVKALETRFHLPMLPWTDDSTESTDVSSTIRENLTQVETIEDIQQRVERQINFILTDRDLKLSTVLGLVEAYDRIMYAIEEEELSELKGHTMLNKLLVKIQEASVG